MRAPVTVHDFLSQRRRIYAGFLSESTPGFEKGTQGRGNALRAVAAVARRNPGELPWVAALFALESLARASYHWQRLTGRQPAYTAWEPAASTKHAIADRSH